jgi:hypothetical protein
MGLGGKGAGPGCGGAGVGPGCGGSGPGPGGDGTGDGSGIGPGCGGSGDGSTGVDAIATMRTPFLGVSRDLPTIGGLNSRCPLG